MLCSEMWCFRVLVLLDSLLENPEMALDALSICMTRLRFIFMISAGFNATASVRVENEPGVEYPKPAGLLVVVVTLVFFPDTNDSCGRGPCPLPCH